MASHPILTCTLALSLLSAAAAAPAADYPERAIRLIVPTAPGSTADVVARVVADHLGRTLGQPLVVENLGGAAGVPGTRQLVAARPDGYTLGLVSSNHAINPSLYQNLPYDAVQDITPISVIGTTPLVLVVAPASPWQSVSDLVAAARTAPGTINYGSSGIGSVLHLAGEQLKARAGIDLMHIPYRGGNSLVTDVLSGQIETAFLATPSVMAQIQSGHLRALAVSTAVRVPELADTPTLDEAGVPGYAYDAWLALIAPAGLPEPRVQTLQAAVQQVMQSPELRQTLGPQGFVSLGTDAAQARQTLVQEIETSRALVAAAGVQAE